jgi:hypothetical protein
MGAMVCPCVTHAHEEPEADGDGNRDDPGGRMLEAQHRGQILRLHDADHHADEAQHGADGEVDVARHDDQHHAAGHHSDGGGLHREIPKIARREKRPAGREMKPGPDHGERDKHADEARGDFEGAEEVGHIALTFLPPLRGKVAFASAKVG